MKVEPEIAWIKLLITIFRHLASGRRYAVITAFFLVFLYAATGRPYGTTELAFITGLPVPDISFAYTSESVYSLLDAYGQIGRDLYLNQILPLDLIFAISYLLFFGTTLGILIRYLFPEKPEFQGLVILPAVGAISDIVENGCFILVMQVYPVQMPLIVSFASVFTKLKFVSNGVTMTLIIAGLVYLGICYGKRLCNR